MTNYSKCINIFNNKEKPGTDPGLRKHFFRNFGRAVLSLQIVISSEISLVKLQSELKINHLNLKLKYSCNIAYQEQINKQGIALPFLKFPKFLYKLIHFMSHSTIFRFFGVFRRYRKKLVASNGLTVVLQMGQSIQEWTK